MMPTQGQPPITPQMMQQFMQQSGGQMPQSPQGSGQPPSPPQGGMPPQGMGAFQQAAQPPRPPMPPQSNPPSGGQPPPMNPAVIMQMIDTLPPQVKQMIAQHIMQNAAQQGRGGDTMLAHLTPGEKTVPPEVQTPKVLATLNKAYKEKGVQPQQFTAGTQQSSHNPSTGLPEYNFMSAFLPAALGIAGSIAAPELTPALLGQGALSGAAASAIGGGLGTTIGGLAAGQSPTQAALSGLGSGAGGYMMGNIGNGLTAMGNTPSAAATMSNADLAALAKSGVPLDQISKMPGGATALGQGTSDVAKQGLAQGFGANSNPDLGNLWGNLPGMAQGNRLNPLGMAGSALGGYVGGAIGAPPKSNKPAYPPGFNDPMHPVGSQGSAQQQLGMTNSVQPRPNYTGFNPMTNYPGAFNFFPSVV